MNLHPQCLIQVILDQISYGVSFKSLNLLTNYFYAIFIYTEKISCNFKIISRESHLQIFVYAACIKSEAISGQK